MIIRPMKPFELTPTDLYSLRYPLYITPKINGVRGLVVDGVMQSSSGKPLPNYSLQQWVKKNKDILEGMDGEIITSHISDPEIWNKSTSFCMSEDKEADFTYVIFDNWKMGGSYNERINELCVLLPIDSFKISCITYLLVHTPEEVTEITDSFIARGYEGSVLRSPKSIYKYGRGTLKEQGMLKLKYFKDSEAEIIGFNELMRNANDQELSELGLAKRSSSKDNKVGGGLLGALIVRDVKTNVQFKIGTGLDDETRIAIWRDREKLKGKVVRYKYYDVHVKTGCPVNPVYEGFRNIKIDC